MSPEVEAIVAKYANQPGAVIPLLQQVQKAEGYLPEKTLHAVSRETGIPLSRLYGVATFYHQFSLVPVGRRVIRVCHGTACHVGGAREVTDAISNELGIEDGETTQDREFTLSSVACLGCCSLAPVMTLGDETHGQLTSEKAKRIVRKKKRQVARERAEGDGE